MNDSPSLKYLLIVTLLQYLGVIMKSNAWHVASWSLLVVILLWQVEPPGVAPFLSPTLRGCLDPEEGGVRQWH